MVRIKLLKRSRESSSDRVKMNKSGRVLDELLERAGMNSGLPPDLVWYGEPDLDHLFTGAEEPRNVSTYKVM